MSIASEARSALRTLWRAPGFTLLGTLILTTGIGLTLYMFGALNGFVLRPLPYPDPDRLVHMEYADPELDGSIEVPAPDFAAMRSQLASVSTLAAFYEGTLNLSDPSADGSPERLDGAFASGDLFGMLGQKPLAGRLLQPADDQPGAPAVVVLSAVLWERRYGSDPLVVGRAVRVNGRSATIVGVAPEAFRFPTRTEAWTTVPAVEYTKSWREAASLEVVGRLAAGSTLDGLRAEIDTVLKRLVGEDSTRSAARRGVAKPLAEEWVGEETRQQLGLMFISVILVLLIACANVANLLYARGLGRQRDLAVRSALGASRRRLMALGLTEALLVGLLASALAVPLAQRAGDWTMETLRANEDMNIPSWVVFRTDAATVAFTLAIALVSALAAGLGPALAGSRSDPQKELRGGLRTPGRSRRVTRILVVTQIALSFGLVTTAALGARSIAKLYRTGVGVDGARILGGRVALFPESYPDDARRLAFYARAESRLRELPGVTSATVTSSLPGSFAGGTRIEIEGEPAPKVGAESSGSGRFATVVRGTPSLFDTLGVALISGRGFQSSDDADSAPVAIVNRRFAAVHFGDADPLGHRFRQLDDEENGPWLTVVGVAPDLQHDDVDDTLRPTFYLPLEQSVPQFAFLAVRSAGADAAPLQAGLVKALHEIAPDQPVYFVRTVDGWIEIIRGSNRFLAGLFAAFAIAGLLLAAVGVYGVAAYAVTQRTAEIGVRRALGARDSSVVRLVAGRSAQDLAWGLTVGLGLAVALGRQVGSFFYQAQALDPVVLLSVPLVLVAAVGLATWMPARRALRIEPAVALRGE